MATRFINQGVAVEGGLGHVAGFAVGADGVLKLNRGPEFKGSLSADPGEEAVQVNRVIAVTATSATLSVADAGAYVACDTTASVTITLPKASTAGKGWEATVGVKQLTSAGGHTVRPNAADTILFTGAAASSALQCDANTDVLGDCVTLRSDGGTTWYIVSKVGTWSAIA